jgi:hypothetical protein
VVPHYGLPMGCKWDKAVYFVGKVEFGWGKDMGVVVVVGEGSGMRCLDRVGW